MKPQLHSFPFSTFGTWLSLSRRKTAAQPDASQVPIGLRKLSGILWEHAEVFQFHPLRNGERIRFDEILKPETLTLRAKSGGGSIRFVYSGPKTLRIRLEGLSLELAGNSPDPYPLYKQAWRLRGGTMGWFLFKTLEGSARFIPATDNGKDKGFGFHIDGENTPAELLIHETLSGGTFPEVEDDFESCVRSCRNDFKRWTVLAPPVNEEFKSLRDRELWNLWQLTVNPIGNVKRKSTLVSKDGLVGIWSWDHCWHMLGLAGIDPELAWNNLLVVLDHQNDLGCLPDVITANQINWGHVKPPVHGWMLGLLEKNYDWVGDAQRREAYPKIAALTKFWLQQRVMHHESVPYYLHGNDSGWDNASVFAQGAPLESPDLCTWLILQQEWLADTAMRLGKNAEAERWETGAVNLTEKMLKHFWTGDRFVARKSGNREPVESDSLLLRIPLLLGERIPQAARDWCLEGLLPGGRFRSGFGLVTEAKDSPYFKGDGYWRGAVWPVEVFIFSEAFKANGLHAEAATLRHNLLRHLEKAGNFENYNGETGEGVRDTSISWTSTVALLFLREE